MVFQLLVIERQVLLLTMGINIVAHSDFRIVSKTSGIARMK